MTCRIARLILLVAAFVAAPVRAEGPAVKAFEKAVEGYEQALADERVVGGAVALVPPDGPTVELRHGYADQDARKPVDEDTVFHWASVTKVFTSIAVMQLVERGVIGLDDPVIDHLPAFAAVHNPFGETGDVTIRHLLTHSSGLRGATWPWNADGGATASAWQPHEPRRWSQIEAMFPLTGLEFEPGSRASYSNLGMSILGRIVEAKSGDDIEIYVDKNILRPLGMHRSFFDTTPWHLAADQAHGYRASGEELRDLGAGVETGATHANGGLNGTMGDMAAFVRWLMDGARSGKILRPETLAHMLEPQFEFARDDRRTIRVGLGFFIVDETDAGGKKHRYFGHSGFQSGHRSSLYVAADGSGGFIFAANTVSEGGNPSAGMLRTRMVDEVWPHLRKGD